MKYTVRNYDEYDYNGNWHGVQICYYPNGNIMWIDDYHHGKFHGYSAVFNPDKSINYKEYWNMDNMIYNEYHANNQIQINI